MSFFEEIEEYPYTGTITRVTPGTGDEDDTESVIYQGVMDEHLVTEEIGRTLQTASYLISIPLTKDDKGKYIVPLKGDKITLNRYDETIDLIVDNSEPSQLQGVTIYASRNTWL